MIITKGGLFKTKFNPYLRKEYCNKVVKITQCKPVVRYKYIDSGLTGYCEINEILEWFEELTDEDKVEYL